MHVKKIDQITYTASSNIGVLLSFSFHDKNMQEQTPAVTTVSRVIKKDRPTLKNKKSITLGHTDNRAFKQVRVANHAISSVDYETSFISRVPEHRLV